MKDYDLRIINLTNRIAELEADLAAATARAYSTDKIREFQAAWASQSADESEEDLHRLRIFNALGVVIDAIEQLAVLAAKESTNGEI